MMFNGMNGYIKRAENIWLVQVIKESGTPDENACTYYEVRIVQTLKGGLKLHEFTACSVGRDLVAGARYVVFGFNMMRPGVWMDNGNISPIPVPGSVSTDELKGKSLDEQLTYIAQARSKEIDGRISDLKREKEVLERGLQNDKRDNDGKKKVAAPN